MDRELEKKKAFERSEKIREQILTFIISFEMENGFAPTVREIGSAVGLKSTSSVQAHLDSMERDGLIQKGSKPRTIKIVDKRYKDSNLQIPLISEFTENIYTKENITGYLTIPKRYIGNGIYAAASTDIVVIRAEGIIPGDILLVHLTDTVPKGQRALIRATGMNALTCCIKTEAHKKESIVGKVTGIFRSFED